MNQQQAHLDEIFRIGKEHRKNMAAIQAKKNALPRPQRRRQQVPRTNNPSKLSNADISNTINSFGYHIKRITGKYNDIRNPQIADARHAITSMKEIQKIMSDWQQANNTMPNNYKLLLKKHDANCKANIKHLEKLIKAAGGK
jgi:hypothetical protein